MTAQVHNENHIYANLEYRCPKCNKLVVKGMLLKGYVEFKCTRCRTRFGFSGPADTNDSQYLILSTEDGVIENCSISTTEQLGYPLEELIGRKIDMLYADESTRTTDNILAKQARDFRYLRFDTNHLKADGSTVEVMVTLRSLSIGSRPQMARHIKIKVLPPKEILEAAACNNMHYNDFENELDLEGNLLYVDKRACDIANMKPEEVIGKCLWSFMTPEEAARRKENTRNFIASGLSYRILDASIPLKSGAIAKYETFATPVYDDFGEPIGFKSINWMKGQ